MSCTACKNKNCRKGADCFGVRSESIELLTGPGFIDISFTASSLIDNGRAGTMTRLQEIIEYCHEMGYKKIGVAYCYGIAGLAQSLESELKSAEFTAVMIQCTTGGVFERDIDPAKTSDTVSCNPAGQALYLKKQSVDFIIEMGLCLGHDVIFHSLIKDMPFTVFVVKDRVLRHSPASALESYSDLNSEFLAGMDSGFRMKSPEWLMDIMASDVPLCIIDLRAAEAYTNSHIPGSINILLPLLPAKFKSAIPFRDTTVVALCNGSVQSAYAIMFLYSRGYSNVFNLSGGFSRWEKEGFPVSSN